MAEESTATEATETPPEPVEGQPAATPANDTAAPANDNAEPAAPTEAEFEAMVEKLGPLKALQLAAKKTGHVIDQTTIGTKDWVELRQAQKKWNKEADERAKALTGQLEQKVKEYEGKFAFADRVQAAFENRDYEEVARLAKFKDWGELVQDHIDKYSNPAAKELREMRARLDEKERAEAEQRKQWQERQQTQQRAAAVQRDRATVSSAMGQSENQVLREMANFPDVVNMVYSVLLRNQDPRTGRTIALDDALNQSLHDGGKPLRSILREWHDALGRAFREASAEAGGGEAGAAAGAAAATAAAKAMGKTEPAPKITPSGTKSRSERDWLRDGAKQLEDAIRAESQREAEERRKGNSAASQ